MPKDFPLSLKTSGLWETTPINPPGSSVSYKNPDFIEVYWGEWLYSFRLHLGVWNVDLRSVPLPCADRPPFLSLPF